MAEELLAFFLRSVQQEEANPLQTAAEYWFIFGCFSNSPKFCSVGGGAATGELPCLISQERRDDCPAATFTFDGGGGGEKEMITKLSTSHSVFFSPPRPNHPPKKKRSFGATLISGAQREGIKTMEARVVGGHETDGHRRQATEATD